MHYTNFPTRNFTKFIAYFYTAWVAFWFVCIFLCLFPFFWLFLQNDNSKPYAHKLNRIWGKILFFIIGIKMDVRYDFKPQKNETYVFVSNHFSYWDIASMGMILDSYFAFVGKSSVKKIPLLGYVFSKLHIQVDRAAKESRAKSMNRAIKALINGRSMLMFAEGGIITRHPPQLAHPFKEGAFVMAIHQQKPIVPITLLNNHEIIWDADMLMRRLPVRAVVHEPILTIGMKSENAKELSEKVWHIIQNELNSYYKKSAFLKP
jgi:1-acyl-sn-glycerol-3-phosphate acyltransferase